MEDSNTDEPVFKRIRTGDDFDETDDESVTDEILEFEEELDEIEEAAEDEEEDTEGETVDDEEEDNEEGEGLEEAEEEEEISEEYIKVPTLLKIESKESSGKGDNLSGK